MFVFGFFKTLRESYNGWLLVSINRRDVVKMQKRPVATSTYTGSHSLNDLVRVSQVMLKDSREENLVPNTGAKIHSDESFQVLSWTSQNMQAVMVSF